MHRPTYPPFKPLSNSISSSPSISNPIKPPSLTGASSNTVSKKAASSTNAINAALRLCTSCKRPMEPITPFRWCESCRMKRREQKKRWKASAKMNNQTVKPETAIKQKDIPKSNEAIYRNVKVERPGNGASECVTPHASSLLGKRNAEEREKNLAEECGVPRKRALKTSSRCEQYQYSSDLLDALCSVVRADKESFLVSGPYTPSITFHGTYSIVADPQISQSQRVEMVSKELKDVGHLSFGIEVRRSMPAPGQLEFTKTFKCTCGHNGKLYTSSTPQTAPTMSTPGGLGTLQISPAVTVTSANHMVRLDNSTGTPFLPPQAPTTIRSLSPSPSATAPVPIKRTQSKLSSWFTSSGSKSRSPSAMPRPSTEVESTYYCGGIVRVKAMEDYSHSLKGFTGQKIIVSVEHTDSN